MNSDSIEFSRLMRDNLRLMRIYNFQVEGTPEQIERFCSKGIANCEGSELSRFLNIMEELNLGLMVVSDGGRPDRIKYMPTVSFEEFMNR